MDSYFDNYCDFSAQHASPSGRTPDSTNYPYHFNPHEPCSYCSDPHHSANNCPSWGQFYNFSYEQMNTNFSSPGFNSNSNFYNPDWSNHSNFSWQAQAMGNHAPQFQELHYPEYSQFDTQSSHPSSYVYPASSSQSTLEDTLKDFMQFSSQTINEIKNATLEITQAISDVKNVTMVDNSAIQEIKDVTVANTSANQKLEGQLNHLIAEYNRLEEEEFQGQLMAEGHYMIDEDDSSNLHHEHVQATSTIESEEMVDGNGNEEEKEEHPEQAAPPPNPNTSEYGMSTEAHSFITIPLETFHEPQALILTCLKEPSYAKTVKDLCTQPRKSRNHRPTKILRSKQVSYIRWRNNSLEGHQFCKKKGWKGLVGHPHDRGRRCKYSFTFLYS